MKRMFVIVVSLVVAVSAMAFVPACRTVTQADGTKVRAFPADIVEAYLLSVEAAVEGADSGFLTLDQMEDAEKARRLMSIGVNAALNGHLVKRGEVVSQDVVDAFKARKVAVEADWAAALQAARDAVPVSFLVPSHLYLLTDVHRTANA